MGEIGLVLDLVRTEVPFLVLITGFSLVVECAQVWLIVFGEIFLHKVR